MRTTRCFRVTLMVLFFLTATGSVLNARAQGLIVPRPCTGCPGPRPISQLPTALPVKSIKIEAKLSGQVATTHVEQVFHNDTDMTLEGTYFFPVPETASVTEFAIWDGERRLVGEVRSREEARRIYDEIVRRQRDPGLLEYAGHDLFQASIFPIPPRSDKKLELTYTQVLRAESGVVGYRYPLGTGRNVQTIGTVSGRVEIESQDPLRSVYSPSHAIDIARDGERRARISFEASAGTPPQDFQLFYGLSRADFGVSLLTYREPGRDGYFLLLIAPKEEWSEQEYSAKDVVFVLDTSGSMADDGKIEKARAALQFGVKSLRAGDRFNIISFSGDEHLMESGLIAADDAGRRRGEEFVRGLRADGGTNINDALGAALRQFQPTDRPKMIVFLTDGLPTVGETSQERIIDNVRKARVAGVRLFTFGVGYDVNTALLDKLAADNDGVADYIEPKEDLEVKVSNFFAKVNYPVLTDLKLEMAGVQTELIYPRHLPDLFKGTQVALLGRYRNASDLQNVKIHLTGRAGQSDRSFTYEDLHFPLREEKNDFLPRLWATRRVGWLMEQIRTNGEQKELRDEVVELGTRYGIVTPYTSYLAVEDNAATDQTITPAPRDSRAGAGDKATGRRSRRGRIDSRNATAPSSVPAATASTGSAAVRESKQTRSEQEADRLEEPSASQGVRHVGEKTFYLVDDVWTDSAFRADAKLPETELVFGTEEYFAVLKRIPALSRFFALGERVVVVLDGRVYRVKAGVK